MAREGSRKAMHPVGLVTALVFSAVFAVAFGAVGYGLGLQPLAKTLRDALAVQGWQPVPAQVLSTQLQQHTGSDSITWQVHARYRYEFAGTAYEGTRVGLDPTGGADNLGDWHERWHSKLQAAQARGESITVRVDPKRPAQSLIDPSLRWPMLAFRLPFALVFTGVGLVAAWVFLNTLWQLLRPRSEAKPAVGEEADQLRPADRGQSPAGRSAGAIWLFSLFWCGISFPMAAILWSADRTPWFAKAFIGLFVAVGVGLLAYAMGQTRRAWRYAGTALTVLPSRPCAGQPVEVTVLLPERAAAHQQGQDLQLRLAQYRVDEASSGSPERRVEAFIQPARALPMPDGGLRLVARFHLPDDAAPHGAQRSGERVDWRLELLHGPDGAAQLTYDIPVQAAPAGWGAGSGGGAALPADDRFDRRAAWTRVTPIEPPDEASAAHHAPPPVPPTAQCEETAEGWRYRFAQTGWRWTAGLAFTGLAVEALIHDRVGLQGLQWPRGFFAASVWWAVLALALHAATTRWTLWVTDAGITVLRSSWLWSRKHTLPGQATASLVHKLLYTAGSGGNEQRYHAVYARLDGSPSLVRLTPGLAGDDAATALGQSLAQAWAHRRGRFSPGALRPVSAARRSRPGWGALLLAVAVAWSVWAPQAPRAPQRGAEASPQPTVAYSAVDGRLLDAQDAGDAVALRAALAEGANPDLLAPSGSSVLMLAAHRGQLDHIEALLAAGARPDLRQTQKDSERGDTALLRAFYGGHLAAARRLVQAGASLAARNRWDWGPVHMAAQSGCIACLDWLAAQGQPLHEPAPASRGETPAMLAAGRGQVAALQWFDARGTDWSRKDAHGMTALDWAGFRHQAQAQQWLAERGR
ncbi:ankyrin repeat domain-containing protein [Acidovorax sp.]|uniref:ankyrin repeat domain-containing protein n=1 Tax=Acidovorax sp. TaxID=1872122 RepID=UPI0039198DAC